MKLLHLTFHKGCELEIEYVCYKLGHDCTVMRFDDGESEGGELYRITHDRAQKCWDKYRMFFEEFDGIITSDTCPVSRVFLQNGWTKLLLIWVCNRFDYSIAPETIDPEFYTLLRDIPNRANVRIFGNTPIENVYSTHVKRVSLGDFVIKPIGKNLISNSLYKTYSDEDRNYIFYVPPYHNETIYMNLSQKLTEMGITNRCERFPNHISDLLVYQGIITIPYAWSTIAFFERLQLGLVMFVPSRGFLLELAHGPNFWFQPPFSLGNPPELLELAEWYCAEHASLMVYFDSWEDLAMKIKTTDYVTLTRRILEFAHAHELSMLDRWSRLIQAYD